jgi:hypothetical protein
LRRLTVDVGLLPLRARSHTPCPFVHAAQPLALRGRARTFIRVLLSCVCRTLAVVRYSLALVSDPASPARLEFTVV